MGENRSIKTVLANQTWAFRDPEGSDGEGDTASLRRSSGGSGGAGSREEGGAARIRLADVPLKTFLAELLIPYDDEEVTRLIVDTHDDAAFGPVSHMCVRDFRGWLLSDRATTAKDCLTYCAFIVARLHFDNVVE